jgi:hypothetical protein
VDHTRDDRRRQLASVRGAGGAVREGSSGPASARYSDVIARAGLLCGGLREGVYVPGWTNASGVNGLGTACCNLGALLRRTGSLVHSRLKDS